MWKSVSLVSETRWICHSRFLKRCSLEICESGFSLILTKEALLIYISVSAYPSLCYEFLFNLLRKQSWLCSIAMQNDHYFATLLMARINSKFHRAKSKELYLSMCHFCKIISNNPRQSYPSSVIFNQLRWIFVCFYFFIFHLSERVIVVPEPLNSWSFPLTGLFRALLHSCKWKPEDEEMPYSILLPGKEWQWT